MPTRFVCGMIYRTNPESGEVEFVVIDSTSTDPRTGHKSERVTKFPGGMNRLPDEPIDMTGRREVLEETYLAFAHYVQVWVKQVGEEHVKYGLLVRFEDCRGEMRREVLVDSGDEMSAPYWESVTVLKSGKLFPGHQLPLLAAMKHLGMF